MVEPARLALFARSFKRASSPVCLEEPRRRDAVRREAVRRDADFLPEAADLRRVPEVRRRAVVFLRRVGVLPPEEEGV
jgi:hypothetical protein